MMEAKRVWFFTDPHIGVRNSAVEWMDSVEAYFRDEMLPLMEKEWKPGDVCACLGDVFDSRNSINIRALNIGHWLFGRLSKIFERTIIILGNHDVFNKSTNEINSVRFLSSIKGVEVYEEPSRITLGGKSVVLMPWRASHDAEKECIAAAESADMLWCHADIRGSTFNKRTVIEDGCGEEDFVKFGRVYTGHIHYRQAKGNVRIIGTPYQLTRSDAGNPKGVIRVDLATMEETFFENTLSPRFFQMTLKRLAEMTLDEFTEHIAGNYVDLYLTADEADFLQVSRLLDHTELAKSFSLWPDAAKAESRIIEDPALEQDFSVGTLIKEYVASRDMPDELKLRMERGLQIIMSQAEEQIGKQ